MDLAEKIETSALLPEKFSRWFSSRGWTPRAHQLELLAKARDGRSVLLIAPAGGGKTLAGFLPTLVELAEPRAPLYLSPLAGRGRPADGGAGEGDSQQTRALQGSPSPGSPLRTSPPSSRTRGVGTGLHTLYISPLKAL